MDRTRQVLLLQTAWALSTLGSFSRSRLVPRQSKHECDLGVPQVTGRQRGFGSSSCSSSVP